MDERLTAGSNTPHGHTADALRLYRGDVLAPTSIGKVTRLGKTCVEQFIDHLVELVEALAG